MAKRCLVFSQQKIPYLLFPLRQKESVIFNVSRSWQSHKTCKKKFKKKSKSNKTMPHKKYQEMPFSFLGINQIGFLKLIIFLFQFWWGWLHQRHSFLRMLFRPKNLQTPHSTLPPISHKHSNSQYGLLQEKFRVHTESYIFIESTIELHRFEHERWLNTWCVAYAVITR